MLCVACGGASSRLKVWGQVFTSNTPALFSFPKYEGGLRAAFSMLRFNSRRAASRSAPRCASGRGGVLDFGRPGARLYRFQNDGLEHGMGVWNLKTPIPGHGRGWHLHQSHVH
jgi:hypothetical protein